jgi:hypothetical protein
MKPASSIEARCVYCGSSSNPLEVQELQRSLAARDKMIALLTRRLEGAPASTANASVAAAQAMALEKIVARQMAELEHERFELEKALTELRATRVRLQDAHSHAEPQSEGQNA